MPYSMHMGFQDATSPIMEEMMFFPDHTLMIVFLISSLVLHIIILMLTTKLTHTSTMDAQEVETIWTIMPAIILVLITLSSLRILYMMDEIHNPYLTVKAMGHQWYWSYDNWVVLPMELPIRMLISSEDVLHAWAVPSLGWKADAIPGWLNQITLMSSRPGVFFGQCSEICGSNHSFMPIVLEMTSLTYFEKWFSMMQSFLSS